MASKSTRRTRWAFRRKVAVAAVLATVSLASCNHNYDTLIEEYNRAFQRLVTAGRVPQPGDPDFKEQNMLLEKYAVSEHATLNLAAPFNCSTYSWELKQIVQTGSVNSTYQESPLQNQVQMSNGTSLSTREFVCFIPTSNLQVDTYRLYLEVRGNDGRTYRDNCLVVIHRSPL